MALFWGQFGSGSTAALHAMASLLKNRLQRRFSKKNRRFSGANSLGSPAMFVVDAVPVCAPAPPICMCATGAFSGRLAAPFNGDHVTLYEVPKTHN